MVSLHSDDRLAERDWNRANAVELQRVGKRARAMVVGESSRRGDRRRQYGQLLARLVRPRAELQRQILSHVAGTGAI